MNIVKWHGMSVHFHSVVSCGKKKSSKMIIKKKSFEPDRASPEACFPDYSVKLLQRSRVFSVILGLVRTKNVKKLGRYFFKVSEQSSTFEAQSV